MIDRLITLTDAIFTYTGKIVQIKYIRPPFLNSMGDFNSVAICLIKLSVQL